MLRDSPFKGDAGFDAVIDRAAGASGFDPHGHRAAFVEMARRAKGLTGRAKE